MTAQAAGQHWNILPLHLDSVVYPDWHPWAGEVGPVYAYLLEDDEHLVLVDTGIGPAHPLIDRLYQPTRRDLALALAQNNGIELDDVDFAVLSHLHFDHVGGAQALRGTPLYVQRTEWEAAQAPKYTVPEFLESPGANFVMVDGDVELAPGLRLVSTPGHTPGHQAVAVSTPLGVMALAGQALDTCAEMVEMVESGDVRKWPDDGRRKQRTESARRLLELAPVRVWFSHDHQVWEPGA